MENVNDLRDFERRLEDLSRRMLRVSDALAPLDDRRYHLFTPVDLPRLDALVEATTCAHRFKREDHGDHWVLTLATCTERERVSLSLIQTDHGQDYIHISEN
jgi:hypothetical protein